MQKKIEGGNSNKIDKQNKRINRDEGRDLSPEWFAIIKKILHGRLQRSYDTLSIAS